MRKMKLDIQLFNGSCSIGTITETTSDAVTNQSTFNIPATATTSGSTYNNSNASMTMEWKYESGSTWTSLGKQTFKIGKSSSVTKNWTLTLTHNDDGTLANVQFRVKWYITDSTNGTTSAKTYTPTTILRGSKLTDFGYNSFPNGSVSYKKYVSSFYDRFTLKSNGITIATIDNPKTSAGTYSDVTLSATVAKYLEAATAGNSKSLTVTCELKTYNSSSYTTQVGDTQTKTAPITLGYSTLSDINDLTIANSGTATFKPSISKVYANSYECIVVSGGSFSQTFNGVSSGSTYTLNSTNLFTAMGTNTSLTLSFTLKTYSSNGGALLGESTISNKTISLPSYDINASVNSYDDKNKSTQPGSMTNPLSYFKTSDSVMIKNLSSPKITFKVTSSTNYLYGRKISTTGAAVKSNLDHNATFDVEPGTNFNSSYSITATDGRKTSTAATKTFTVVPYFLPSVTVKIERTAPTATTATATIVAKYYNDSGSLLTNKKTLSTINTAILTYTEYGGSAVTKSYSQANNVSTSTSGTTTTLTFTYNLTGLDYQKSINVAAQFKDLIGYTVQGTDYEPNGLPVINAFRYNDKNYAKVNGDLIVSGQIRNISSLNLESLSTSNFYPLIFEDTDAFKDIYIKSYSTQASSPYNQNRIIFTLSARGWSDTPVSLFIKEYSCYDNNEITIGCIGAGNAGGYRTCVWLRGGLVYEISSSVGYELKTSTATYGTETYSVGSNYYGGTNSNVDILFTPQTTIKKGSYNNNGIATKGKLSTSYAGSDGVRIEHNTANQAAMLTAKRNDTGNTICFGVASGGINRGIWDESLGKWALWSDSVNTYHRGIMRVDDNSADGYGVINDDGHSILRAYQGNTYIHAGDASHDLWLGANHTRSIIFNQCFAGHRLNGGSGTSGYMLIGTFNITSTYMNQPMIFEVKQRSRHGNIYVQFASGNTNDPSLSEFKTDGNISAYMYKSATSTWKLWVYKSESYDDIDVLMKKGNYSNSVNFTWNNTTDASLPSGYVTATPYVVEQKASGSFSLTNTTGSSGSLKYVVYGKILFVEVQFTSKSSSTSAGNDCYVGKIPDGSNAWTRPYGHAAELCGFYSSCSLICSIDTSGTVTVRVLGATLNASSTGYVRGTYIVS